MVLRVRVAIETSTVQFIFVFGELSDNLFKVNLFYSQENRPPFLDHLLQLHLKTFNEVFSKQFFTMAQGLIQVDLDIGIPILGISIMGAQIIKG